MLKEEIVGRSEVLGVRNMYKNGKLWVGECRKS